MPNSKTTSLQATVTPPSENVPTEDSDKTQSVFSGQTAHPQDTMRHTQPAVKGFHSPLDKGIRSSKPLLEGKSTDAKDPRGNMQPAGMRLPSTTLDEGTSKSLPLPKCKLIDPKESEGNKQPTDMGLPATHLDKGINTTQPLPEGTNTDPKVLERLKPLANMVSSTPLVTALSRTDAKYQVDQTHSTRFEVSVPDQHQSKTSFEMELDSEPLDQTNKLMKKTMNRLDKISQARVDERAKLLKTLNRVFETLEADSVLKEAMKKMAETNNTTFGNLTSLTELLKNAQLPKILTQLNAFQTSLNTFSSRCTSISNSLKKETKFYQRLLRLHSEFHHAH
ncbi:hypothetical protein Tco_0691927 [Tanacetum coccineum]